MAVSRRALSAGRSGQFHHTRWRFSRKACQQFDLLVVCRHAGPGRAGRGRWRGLPYCSWSHDGFNSCVICVPRQ